MSKLQHEQGSCLVECLLGYTYDHGESPAHPTRTLTTRGVYGPQLNHMEHRAPRIPKSPIRSFQTAPGSALGRPFDSPARRRRSSQRGGAGQRQASTSSVSVKGSFRWRAGGEGGLWSGQRKSVRGWPKVIQQVHKAYVRPPFGNSTPVMQWLYRF